MIINTQIAKQFRIWSPCAAALLAVCLVACKTPWWTKSEEDSATSAASSDWLEQSNRTALLALSADDYEGLNSRGAPIQWQPVLMPLRTGYALTDKSFAVGTTGPLGNIDGRLPEPGQCQLLTNSSTVDPGESQGNTGLSNIQFELEDPKGQRLLGQGGQLFLIHEQSTRFVRAIGFWDDDGRAVCGLPVGRWIVSSGFGEARSHKPFTTTTQREAKVPLRTLPRARLIIRTGKDTGLQIGDLMRIGRRQAEQPAPQSSEDLPEVPLLIQDDLMRGVLSPSENDGVREYLFTSLLLQRQEFSLPLEPGEYTVSLWRDGFMSACTSRMIVKSGDLAVLTCEPQSSKTSDNNNAQIADERQTFTSFAAPSDTAITGLIFDGSFMPSRLLSQNSFRSWLAKNGVNRFLRAGRSLDGQQQFQFLLQPLLQSVSIDGLTNPEGPFTGDFRLTQKANVEEKSRRSSFARMLYAQAGLSVEASLTRAFALNNANLIPLAGISERGLLEGVVPLTFRTHLRTAAGRALRTEESEVYASNGALIEWLEPVPALAGSPLKLGPQQRIRIRLTVPPGDTTEFLTMYVNGEPYKQWPVPLSQHKSIFRTLEVDEKISFVNDFYLGFASWGKTYLSEYMFGVRQLPAIGFTRSYCVDINENAVCERQ